MMVSKELSSDEDWHTVYAILVNELEVLVDRAKSELVYEQDIKSVGLIIDELSRQGLSLTKEEPPVMDIVRSQVIEMIALQATSNYSTGSSIKWDDMEVRPTFDEEWFWDNFNEMVDQACMTLKDAVEGWVTVQYEEDIIDLIDSHAKG